MKNIMFYTHVSPQFGKLAVRGYYNGKRFSEKVKYNPYLFVETNKAEKATHFNHTKTKKLAKVVFESTTEAREFVKRYEDVDNFKIYGNTRYHFDWISDNYPDAIPYDMDVMSIVSLDIEVASDDGFPEPSLASKEITAITLSKRGKYYVFGCGDYTAKSPDVKYCKCRNERELLYKFLDFWKILDPDVVTGWNVELFDMPYIYNRLKNVLSEEEADSLSHWGVVTEKEINQKYGKGVVKIFSGFTILDYMVLYKKFSNTPQENYRLNTIAMHELDVGKIEYTGSLTSLYKEEYTKFIDYNIRDVEIINKLDDKLKFIELTCAIAYDAKVNIADALTTVVLWDVIIQNYLKKKNIVVPFIKIESSTFDNSHSIEGGYVKDPQTGYHEWVVSWDFDSLYPHIAMMLNISPDTYDGNIFKHISDVPFSSLVDEFLEKGINPEITDFVHTNNYSIALNGAMFLNDRVGFFSDLMKIMYQDRVKYKKIATEAKKEYDKNPSEELKKKISKYNAFQYAKKIQLNSAYGATANMYFRWFDNALAEAITKTGQFCIRYIEKRMNEYLNVKFNTQKVDYVVASDTDSVYVKFNKKELIDEADINSKINEWCEEIYKILNVYDKALRMKREAISSSAVWTSKKHYVLNMVDLEGFVFKEPKLKMMGIEAVKSSTPSAIRKYMIDTIKIVMNGTQEGLFNYVEKARRDFRTRPYEETSFPRSVNGLDKYSDTVSIWSKGTPIQVKGALVHNNYIKAKKLNLPLISDGDKIKFCYLKTPNPVKSEVISALNELPSEFNLERYIDYEKQFEKSFVAPITTIVEKRGWSIEKRSTLFDL